MIKIFLIKINLIKTKKLRVNLSNNYVFCKKTKSDFKNYSNNDHRLSPVILFYLKVSPRGLFDFKRIQEFRVINIIYCWRMLDFLCWLIAPGKKNAFRFWGFGNAFKK